MGRNDFAIDYQPDALSGASMLLGAMQNRRDDARADENMQIQRANSDINLRRISAQEVRESRDYQERQADKMRQRKIDQAGALEHASQLVRSRRFGEAQAHARAYDIDLHEAVNKAATDETKARAEQPMLLQAAMPPQQDYPQIPQAGEPLAPGAEGPIQQPDMEPPPMMADAGPPVEGPEQEPIGGIIRPTQEEFTIQADVPPRPMPPSPQMMASSDVQAPQMYDQGPPSQAMQVSQQSPMQRAMPLLFQAVMNGQTYDIGSGSGTAGLGEPYDTMYREMMDGGEFDPKEAKAAVIRQKYADAAAETADKRMANVFGHQDTTREDTQAAQRDRDKFQADEAMKRAQLRGKKKGTGTGGGGGGDALKAFVEAAGKLKPGDDIPPEVAVLGQRAGLKPNQIASEVDRYRNSGKKSDKGSGALTTRQLSEADQGIRDLDRLIAEIQQNPRAWEEYRGNAESWARNEGFRKSAVGSLGQMTHLMDVRPEQGLKSGEAKRVFQYQEKLNTSIAKSFGGVITQGDREAAGSQQANFAIDSGAKLRQLQEMRADIVAKRSTFTASDAPSGGAKPAASGNLDELEALIDRMGR